MGYLHDIHVHVHTKKNLKNTRLLFSEWKMMNDGHLILKRARFEIHN